MIKRTLLSTLVSSALALTATAAQAHTEVASTSPRSGKTASTATRSVTVTFTGQIRRGTLSVTRAGRKVSRGSGGVDPRSVKRLRVALVEEAAVAEIEAVFLIEQPVGRRPELLVAIAGVARIAGSPPEFHERSRVANRAIETGTLYLVDSGAQYLDATTDITRTVALGEPEPEMRERFHSEAREVLVEHSIDWEWENTRFFAPQRGDKKALVELSCAMRSSTAWRK